MNDAFVDVDRETVQYMWLAADHYLAKEFVRTSKPQAFMARMHAALNDPRTFEAARLAKAAGLDLPAGWMFPAGPKLALVPSLNALGNERPWTR